MNAEPQQASDDHDSGSNYSDSESEYSSDPDPTAEDGDHQHTTTSNKHPRTDEIVTEKPDILTQDDSDTDNSLEQILLSLRRTMNDEILKAAGMAKSMNSLHDEAYQRSLEEASNRVNRLAHRKEHYKNESRRLEEERKSLREEVDNLKAGMDAAREKAMELFK
jgi:chromosome segregation ATPase